MGVVSQAEPLHHNAEWVEFRLNLLGSLLAVADGFSRPRAGFSFALANSCVHVRRT